jgi:hypothetical protein
MKVIREFWFSPRLHCKTSSDQCWDDMLRGCRAEDTYKAIQSLAEKTNEELGQMVREWINHPDVGCYPMDFAELENEEVSDEL